MPNDTKAIVNLDYVVHAVQNDLEDYSQVYYKKYLQYAIDGMLEMSLFVGTSIKVAYLPFNTTLKTAELPIDYISYTKIGYDNGGVVALFGLNDSLMLARNTDDCGNQVNTNTNGCGEESTSAGTSGVSSLSFPYLGYYYAPHWRGGQYVGELFSGSGGRHGDGEFRIDHLNRQIVFNSEVNTTEIILEYLSSGVSEDGSTCIPREYIPALKAYVHWQRREHKDKVSQHTKDALRDRYYDAFKQVKSFKLAFTARELLDVLRSSYKQTPKR